MLDDFKTEEELRTDETSIHVRWSGVGFPLLLLHGFPETHLMWRNVAPLLASDLTVVCADLRGYGQQPLSGFRRRPCALCEAGDGAGHGEGHGAPGGAFHGSRLPGTDSRWPGRPLSTGPRESSGQSIERLAGSSMYSPRRRSGIVRMTRFALAYWPWSAPAPARTFSGTPLVPVAGEAIVDEALGGWGSPAHVFPEKVRAAYIEALRTPDHAHAICEEYRAGATGSTESMMRG